MLNCGHTHTHTHTRRAVFLYVKLLQLLSDVMGHEYKKQQLNFNGPREIFPKLRQKHLVGPLVGT